MGNVFAVPELSSLAMFVIGLGAIGMELRKQSSFTASLLPRLRRRWPARWPCRHLDEQGYLDAEILLDRSSVFGKGPQLVLAAGELKVLQKGIDRQAFFRCRRRGPRILAR